MAAPTLKVLVVYGTRPEAIKMAPVIAALRRRTERFAVTLCTTGQHRELLDQAQELFGLRPERDLRLMRTAQALNQLAAAALDAMDTVLVEEQPDWVLVQGDTTTAMAAAVAAFHRRVRVGHVEAGLRTHDLKRPFPEEANRRIADAVSTALFAPTPRAAEALRRAGCDPAAVHVVGNTVVDALEMLRPELADAAQPDGPGGPLEVLVTLHRRESFGEPVRHVLAALRRLALAFPAVRWVFPVHPNPEVRGPAHEALGSLPNLELHEPFDYRQLLARLARCHFVLTDSGGIQEEAPTFSKPVLVLREATERPEGIEAGVARLVGTDGDRIVAAASQLLGSPAAYARMARAVNPYGDGRAAERIVAILAGEPWTPFVPAPAPAVAEAASTRM